MSLQAPPGHPARGRFFGVAAGLLARRSPLSPCLPNAMPHQWLQDSGTTHCLQLRGQRRNLAHFCAITDFPLSHHELRRGGPWQLYLVRFAQSCQWCASAAYENSGSPCWSCEQPQRLAATGNRVDASTTLSVS